MSESSLAVILLGVITAGFIALVIIVQSTARDLRRTLRRVNEMLPQAGRTLHEARGAFHQARQLIARTNHAAKDVEAVVRETCDTMLDALNRIALWRERAQGFLKEHFGNGAGADPRRHHGRR